MSTNTLTQLPTFTSSSPGKIILSGEHAVVHGSHAVATVIDKRTYATIEMNNNKPTIQLIIKHPQLDAIHEWHINDIIKIQSLSNITINKYDNNDNDNIQQIKNITNGISTLTGYEKPAISVFILYITYLIHNLNQLLPLGFICTVHSELPMGSGLGSSASYTTALATVLLQLQYYINTKQNNTTQQLQPLQINSKLQQVINFWSYEGEKLIHGNPSGVDNTCSVYGGCILYKRGEQFSIIDNIPPIRMLICNTGIEKNTKQLVANVGLVYNQLPNVIQHVFDAINQISLTTVEKIKQLNNNTTTNAASTTQTNGHTTSTTNYTIEQFLHDLSNLFRLNQHLLNSINVGHPVIDQIITLCKSYTPSLSGKITGAGGGGCVIILLDNSMDNNNVNQLINILKTQCNVADCFETVIGQDGARLESKPYIA